MGKEGRKSPSHRDLVKTVSKQLKYYFELRRQEDGFDLSGPECPRQDYPALRSRPMLLYEGLHDRSVKHFYSDETVKQQLTHLRSYNGSTADSKKVKTLMKKVIDRTTYVPPWSGNGMYSGVARYTKNSEKYVGSSFGEWSLRKKDSQRRGYGNPEPTLKRAFKDSPNAKPRVLRSCPPAWIDNRECSRLISDASRILASSEFREMGSRPQSSRPYSYRIGSAISRNRNQRVRDRARSVSPPRTARSSLNRESARESVHTRSRESSRERLRDRSRSEDSYRERSKESYTERSVESSRERSRESSQDRLRDDSRDRSRSYTPESDRHGSASVEEETSNTKKKDEPPVVVVEPATPPEPLSRRRPRFKPGPPLKKTTTPSKAVRKPTVLPQQKSSSSSRLVSRPQSTKNVIKRRGGGGHVTYHDAKDDFVREHEKKKTEENFRKNRVYYDSDGKKKPLPYKLRNEQGYLEQDGDRAAGQPQEELADEKVPDWLRNQMRRQDVDEKRLPYNRSVKPVSPPEPDTARSEDFTRREGVRRRPKSAKRSKSRSSRGDRDNDSHITLSEGSYEQVRLDDSEDEEDTYVEERGCQTDWELFVNYDQKENILSDLSIDPTDYKVTVRTGTCVGASTKSAVHLILYGSRGRSVDIELSDCINHKIPFQQGATDRFTVTSSYVGLLGQIQIGHDRDSIGDGWFLDSVTIEDPVKGELYEFVCKNWLSIRSEDKKTRRDLVVSAYRKMSPPHSDIEEDEVEAEADEAIEKVTDSNTPRSSVTTSSKSDQGSQFSTTHLNNDSKASEKSQHSKASVGLPSIADSDATVIGERNEDPKQLHQQDPYVILNGRRAGRRSPRSIEDFESDIARHSDKRSVASSRRSADEEAMSESECHTAVFEEQSILSEHPQSITSERPQKNEDELAAERMEAFKAGQKAERDRQRKQQEMEKQVTETATNELLRGPTIHHSAKSGDVSRMKQLLDHNPDLKDSTDVRGNTPLHLAAINGHNEVVKLLVAMGADLQVRDQAGYEPTHVAALHGHVNCLMTLVAMGATVNSQTDDSKTPLHLAAMSGNMETCKWLVANKSHMEMEDDFGRKPVDMAENNSHDDVAMFLRTCVNEVRARKDSTGSLAMLLNNDNEDSWKDDQKEKPVVSNRGGESDENAESIADLRKEAKEKEELKAKQKAYNDMQEKLKNSNMTLLDQIRYEVDNS